MAEFIFSILDVVADLKEQTVTITTSLELDEDSVTLDDMYLVHKRSNKVALFDLSVDGDTITLKLKENAVPNEEYTLICNKDIYSITGKQIELALAKTIIFKSKVTSDIVITSPYNFEEIYGPTILKWKEIPATNQTQEDMEGKYDIEVATDNGFYNKVFKTSVEDDSPEKDKVEEATLKTLEPGQYFVRIRAVDKNSKDYGIWSPTITFIKKEAVIDEKQESKPTIPVTTNPPPDVPIPRTGFEKDKDKKPETPKPPVDLPGSGGNKPNIVDLVKKQPEFKEGEEPFELVYEKYYEMMPENFSIEFPFLIDIKQATVEIVRSDT